MAWRRKKPQWPDDVVPKVVAFHGDRYVLSSSRHISPTSGMGVIADFDDDDESERLEYRYIVESDAQ